MQTRLVSETKAAAVGADRALSGVNCFNHMQRVRAQKRSAENLLKDIEMSVASGDSPVRAGLNRQANENSNSKADIVAVNSLQPDENEESGPDKYKDGDSDGPDSQYGVEDGADEEQEDFEEYDQEVEESSEAEESDDSAPHFS